MEIRLGSLNVPAHGVELMPSTKGKIKVTVDGKDRELSYNPTYRRIFGLTAWYKKHNAKPKDEVEFSKNGHNKYEVKFRGELSSREVVQTEKTEALHDLSGLSSQAKGDIVEDRIKEFLVLHGQGLLSVYKPVTDTEGIDLIVVRNGQFHPIFLQVKGRYNLHQGRSLILSIKVKTFTPHSNFFVVGAFFNPKSLEIDENIILIPSQDLARKAITVTSKKTGESYRVVTSLTGSSERKWSKYIVKKDELATKLIEKFEEIQKYIK